MVSLYTTSCFRAIFAIIAMPFRIFCVKVTVIASRVILVNTRQFVSKIIKEVFHHSSRPSMGHLILADSCCSQGFDCHLPVATPGSLG